VQLLQAPGAGRADAPGGDPELLADLLVGELRVGEEQSQQVAVFGSEFVQTRVNGGLCFQAHEVFVQIDMAWPFEAAGLHLGINQVDPLARG